MRIVKAVFFIVAATAMSSSAGSQPEAADSPVVQQRSSSCAPLCPALINRNLSSRVVVTLEEVPSETWPMYDTAGNRVQLTARTTPVLLQAGETRPLTPLLLVEQGAGGQTRRDVTFTYRIAGFYIPRPDLADLPAGEPRDSARLYVQRLHYLDGSDACGTGNPHTGLILRNINYYRSIAVTYRNLRPHLNNNEQTAYLSPGQEIPLGCETDWPVLTISNVRFSN